MQSRSQGTAMNLLKVFCFLSCFILRVAWELFPIIKVGYLLHPSKVYTHKNKQFPHIFGSHTSKMALLPRNMCSLHVLLIKIQFLLIKCVRSTYSLVAEPIRIFGTQKYVGIACFCEYKLLRGAAAILL